jgi:hypothetical protein
MRVKNRFQNRGRCERSLRMISHRETDAGAEYLKTGSGNLPLIAVAYQRYFKVPRTIRPSPRLQ